MAAYELKFRRSVARDLLTLPKRAQDQLPARMLSLADNPRPDDCEKLSGQSRYRLRHGECRIVYEIRDAEQSVVVVKVGQRRENFSLF
jgi:mRNA interferase RelE/StbE